MLLKRLHFPGWEARMWGFGPIIRREAMELRTEFMRAELLQFVRTVTHRSAGQGRLARKDRNSLQLVDVTQSSCYIG